MIKYSYEIINKIFTHCRTFYGGIYLSSSCPRHKRLNRTSRLQAAEKWLEKYTGKNIVRGYRKHFGVNLLCAALELQALGYVVSETYN
jgi:hypothetical protein